MDLVKVVSTNFLLKTETKFQNAFRLKSTLSKDITITPNWCTWWSATDGTGEVVQKDRPPTDRGHISDIIETWGLKGTADSLENDSDTRLWIQFYPNSGNSFGPLDNFLYCGNSDALDSEIS